MPEKDIQEKTLEAYNDVFADIVNVLLFDGRRVIQDDELEAATARSQYKTDGKTHEQERDVAKYWKNSSVRIAFYGLENQTAIDVDIPLRIISYDGAAYRAQLLDRERHSRYPVVTLVLYFGMKRWNRPHSLKECLEVPPELEPFVSDYKANIFEIAYLTPEQVQLFQSDFKYVADYFVQVRTTNDYKPSAEEIRHVHETLQLMSALTNDTRFEDECNIAQKGESVTMCEILDRKLNQSRAEGRAEGRMEGMQTGMLTALQNLMQSLNTSVEQAMEILKVPPQEREQYARLLQH